MIVLAYTLSVLLMILLPIALAVLLRRRFQVPWWLFCVGMLAFVVAQSYHLPLNNWLTDRGVIGPVAADDPKLLQTALVLGFSAGISETLARVLTYWLLFRRRLAQRWEDGMMVGLGHGGIEAMVFGGVLTAAGITSLLSLQGADLTTLDIPAEQLPLVVRQLEMLTTSPAVSFAPLLERMIAMTLHVVLSLLVWLAFKQWAPLYVLLAVVLHGLFDTMAVLLPQRFDNPWLIEGIFVLAVLPGLAWVWFGYRRRFAEQTAVANRPMALSTTAHLFLTAFRKELWQQWRTKRFWW